MADEFTRSPPPYENNYSRGVEDYRKEQDSYRDNHTSLSPHCSTPPAMISSRGRSPSPRRRSRSRSPIRRRSRTPPRRDKGRDSRGGYRGPRTVRDKSCRVYVSNLCYDIKWMMLKDVMKKVGTVEHVEIFTDNEGRSKGCAVVEYSHNEKAAKAITELDGVELGGRKLRLREDMMDDAIYKEQLKTQKDKTQRQHHQQQFNDQVTSSNMNPNLGMNAGLSGFGGLGGNLAGLGAGGLGGLSALLGAQNTQLQILTLLNSKGGDPINNSVFVSNLDYELNWQKLKDMFRKVGNCVRVDIAHDDDNRSKGFGSVLFETPMEALSAVAMFNGTEAGNARRCMSVRLDRSASLHQLLGQLGISSNDINQKTLVQLQSLATVAMLGVGGLGGGLGNLAGIGGALGLGAGLGGNLSNSQSTVGNQSLSGSTSGGLSGLAGLSNSLTGLSSLLGGSVLTGNTGLSSLANLSSPSLSRNYGGAGNNPIGGSGGLSYNSMPSLGGSLGSSHSDRRDSRYGSSNASNSGTRVFMKNLPFSLRWQDLKDRFRDAGKVVRADIMKTDDGRSKGCGTVTFESSAEASRAVNLFNGMRIDGREIEVRIDMM